MKIIYSLIAAFILIGCQSNMKKSRSAVHTVCTNLVHEEKVNSTADFQACSYNASNVLVFIDKPEKGKGISLYNLGNDKFAYVTEKSSKKRDKLVRACMKEQGWKYVTSKSQCGKKSFHNASEDIDKCLESSKVGELIDHTLMNNCLNARPTYQK